MVKPLARIVAFLTLSLLLALGGVGLWLKQDVRKLTWAKPWLMEALNPKDAPYKITFGDVSIDWRHLSRFGRIQIDHMVVTLLDGTVFASMPDVEVSIDPLGFLPRHTPLHTIIMIAPKLGLTRGAEGAIRMGLNEEGQSLPLNDFIGFFAGAGDSNTESKNVHLPFRAFAVERAAFTMRDEVGGGMLTSYPFTFRLARHGRHSFSGLLSMPFTHNGRAGRIEARLSRSLTGHQHLLSVALAKFPAELFCQFGVCPKETSPLGAVSGEGLLSGRMSLTLDKGNKLVGGSVGMQAEKATLVAPKFFPEPLKLKEGNLFGTISQNGTNILVERTRLVFDDVVLLGRVQFLTLGDKWRLIASGRSGRLDVKKLYKYWPIVLAGDSREWVTGKLKAGYAASGTVALNITSKMYETNSFTPESVQSTVDARDITAEYLQGFPDIKHVNGIAKFVGRTLRVDATSGSLLSGTKINSAVLTCDNLFHPKAPMVAQMNLSSPAKDVAELLKLEHFAFDDSWKLDPDTITGTVDSDMTLAFDAFSDRPEDAGVHFDNVKYDITANLKKVAQPNILGSMNVRDLSGTVHASNTDLKFDGRLGLSATTGLSIALAQDAKGRTEADITGSIPRTEFSVLGIPERKQLGEGNLGLNAHVELGKTSMKIARASLDLSDLAMDVPEISWSKPRGEKGSLTLSPREEKNSYAMAFMARDLKVEDATLKLTDDNEIAVISLPRVISDYNDFAADYTATTDGFTVDLRGKKLDNSVSYAMKNNALLADFPPITLNVNLDELALVREDPLREVKGNLTCNKQRCESANITAKAGKGLLKAIISRVGGKRQFQLTGSDAGEILKGLAITDRLYDGKLDVTGKYDDTKQPISFNGRLLITNFTLKNSEILGRILSIASITGIGDALTGKGISFDKLGADLRHVNGVVEVKNGRASGASLGITMEGKVDTTTTKLNMNGVLVPANLINSILPKIPVIGWVAGKEGEGLIAFNYKVDGEYSDPDINVNPLSGLTPGFLRGVFGGGSSDNPTKAGEPAAYPGDRPMPSIPVKKKPAPPAASAPTTPAEPSL